MKSLIVASSVLLAALVAAEAGPGLKTVFEIPLAGVPSRHATGAGGDMFYAQVDGSTVGYNLTTKEKQFDKLIGGGQVTGYLVLETMVLVATEGGTLAFKHNGDFLWDSGDVALGTSPNPDHYQINDAGTKLFNVRNGLDADSITTIDLLTGTSTNNAVIGSWSWGKSVYYIDLSFSSGKKSLKMMNLEKGADTTVVCDEIKGGLFYIDYEGTLAYTWDDSVNMLQLYQIDKTTKSCKLYKETHVHYAGGWNFGPVYNDQSIVVVSSHHLEHPTKFFAVPVLNTFTLDLKFIRNETLPGMNQFRAKSLYNSVMVFAPLETYIVNSVGEISKKELIPSFPNDPVLNLGNYYLVPNLQGYTFWNSKFDYLFRNEHTPTTGGPAALVYQQGQAVYVTAVGSTCIGFKLVNEGDKKQK